MAVFNTVFVKLGSQLTADKLTDLAIIPVIFGVQTLVSYSCAWAVTRCLHFKKRKANFVTAMAVCGLLSTLSIGSHRDRYHGFRPSTVVQR